EPVSTRPAIQCHCTQGNFTPTTGRKAVNSSTNIAAAITQWKRRAVRPCRSIFAGRFLCCASRASVSALDRLRCPEKHKELACATKNRMPANNDAQNRFHETWVRTHSPHGLRPHFKRSMYHLPTHEWPV